MAMESAFFLASTAICLLVQRRHNKSMKAELFMQWLPVLALDPTPLYMISVSAISAASSSLVCSSLFLERYCPTFCVFRPTADTALPQSHSTVRLPPGWSPWTSAARAWSPVTLTKAGLQGISCSVEGLIIVLCTSFGSGFSCLATANWVAKV